MSDHHINDGQYGSGHGSLKSYIVGFILSILLTIVSFAVVVKQLLSVEWVVVTIVLAAIAQLLVQLIFFLHLSQESKPRWNFIAFVFTVLVVAILLAGSIWIMYNLNYNMTH